MGRLIDADALIEKLEEKMFNSQSMCPVIKITDVMSLIDEQPTAYDPEAVVAELDKSSFLMEPRKKGHYADNGVFLDEAIKIVRKGGAT